MCRRAYAGIGSRETPENILAGMQRIAARLEACGYLLRSGGCSGADVYFEQGVLDSSLTEIWIPWNGYNGRDSKEGPHIKVLDPQSQVIELSAKFHPAWHKCDQTARKLHARNYHIILGEDIHSPVDFVICWTKDGGEQNAMGGTGQGVRIASKHNIPVFNLANKESRYLLKSKVEELEAICLSQQSELISLV